MRKQRGDEAKPKESSTAGGGGAAWLKKGRNSTLLRRRGKVTFALGFLFCFVLFENKSIPFLFLEEEKNIHISTQIGKSIMNSQW